MSRTEHAPSTDDPGELLAMTDRHRDQTAAATAPDPRVVYTVWGVAWLIGFGLVWAAAHDRVATNIVAWLVFGAVMVTALVVTMVHLAHRVAGVRGMSARRGTMYGIAWPVAFAAATAVVFGVARQGLPDDSAALLFTACAGLLVGTLYLGGGALYEDRVQYGLGLWILIATGVATLTGYPGQYVVMALGGGGGFLVMGAVSALHRSRRT